MADAIEKRSTSRLENIDGMRGIAAVLVMFQHMLTNPILLASSNAASSWMLLISMRSFDLGKLGVLMFFAVSGYVIPFSFKGKNPLGRFLITRFFRLYPAYWLSLALAVLIMKILGNAVNVGQLLVNITMMQRVMGVQDILGVYWTLFVELLFYALCMAACAAGLLKRPGFVMLSLSGWTLLLVAMAAFIYVTGKKLPLVPIFGLSMMYLGSLMRFAQIEGNAFAKRMMPVGIAIVFVGQTVACFLAYAKVHDPRVSSWIAQALATAVAIVGFWAASRYHGRVARTLTFFGAISYALYLVHEIVIMALAPMFRDSGLVGGAVFSVLTAVLATFAAWLIFRYLEKPLIATGHAIVASRAASGER